MKSRLLLKRCLKILVTESYSQIEEKKEKEMSTGTENDRKMIRLFERCLTVEKFRGQDTVFYVKRYHVSGIPRLA